ncbi:MAG TPA: 50S ribosomal protein L25 [Anaerolineaceae bacterium]|nr:50S ribosomal protein L25 [Anaerolineaceae bacterium]HPN52434.1 50S ribosomal protein L25 [Anaerolineaceae bacterium]
MEKIVIQATRRTVTGKKVSLLRREGKLPGVIYGHHVNPIAITMDLKETTRLLSLATNTTLVTINVEGEEYATLVREKQRNYVANSLLHVDFQAVSLTEKIRAKVNVEIVGVSPAVKDFNGIVVNGIDKIEVECFPQDLPASITVDISGLKKIGDGITLADLPTIPNVEFLDDMNEMIVSVTSTAAEESAEAAAAPAEPELVERKKKEVVED